MSPAPSTPVRARGRLLRRLAGAAAIAALLATATVALWPASEADQARADGEQLGTAVGRLCEADTSAEVDAALADFDAAVSDARAHAGDELADQVADQQDALARAADGYAGAVSSDDAWESELYEAELDDALDDLTDQASDFRAQGPEVHQAFWQGVEDGLQTA